MEDFKSQVDSLIENRKRNLGKIEADEEAIQTLQTKLQEIKNLVEKTDDAKIKKSSAILNDTLKKLSVALQKVRNVHDRFSRDTISIGVSGAARVGKSTVLQNLSGLTDKQIKTGSGQPVTAVRSQIFNQESGEEEKAVITFYSKDEFIEKRVKPLLSDSLPQQIDDIDDFKNADFTKEFDSSDPLQVGKNKRREKLLSMQNALPYFEGLLGTSEKTITNLDDVEKYTAYSEGDENRLYPAVKNVDIYCHFPSLDGVKVQLLDLPGFGEIGGVDKIQLEGLETEVDHALVILRPSETDSYVGIEYSNMANILSSVQKDVKDRKNLMSYALNVDKGMSNAESLAETLKKDLVKNDKNVSDGENLYAIEAIEEQSVQEMFASILQRMITALPEMDGDFLSAYKTNLGFDEIKANLHSILDVIKNLVYSIPNESTKISEKANDIRRVLNLELKEKMNDIGDSIQERLGDAVDAIKNPLDSGIRNNDLLFEPHGIYTSWEKWVKLRNTQNDFPSMYALERERIRIRILDSYEGLNDFYKTEIERIRTEIIGKFKELTGHFVPDGKSSEEVLNLIIEKLSQIGQEAEPLIQAFDWLKSLRIEFRQSVYPLIFHSAEMVDFRKSFEWKDEYNGKSDEDKISLMKERLKLLALSLNDIIRNKILDEDITSAFIKASLEHFGDMLIRKDEDKVENAFRVFVEQYKEEIMFDEFGKTYDKTSLLKLQNSIKSVLGDMESMEEK